MNIENPLRLVRELKGAPLSILIVLGMVKQRVTQEYLERATGYTDKPVSQALEYMREIGLVDRTSAGWQITRGAAQLPLTLAIDGGQQAHTSERAHSNDRAEQTEPGEQADAPAEDTDEAETSRKYSDSITTTTTINPVINNDEVVVVINEPGRKNSDSLAETLAKCGIQDPALRRLAAKKHLTVDHVLGHEEQLRRSKGDRYTPGLLIYVLDRVQPGDHPPPRQLNDDEQRRRYVTGEFADFIEH